MSGRRSGRLLGVTLALIALAALTGGVLDAGFNFTTLEYDWTASVTTALVP